MESLEITENKPIQSISSYFGGEEDDDIPDMTEYDGQDNVIEEDPVSLFVSVLPSSKDIFNLVS